jgi:hypothetical protein
MSHSSSLEQLLLTVLAAEEVASTGWIARGYEMLLVGLHGARESSGEAGLPADDLQRRWQEALDQ